MVGIPKILNTKKMWCIIYSEMALNNLIDQERMGNSFKKIESRRYF